MTHPDAPTGPKIISETMLHSDTRARFPVEKLFTDGKKKNLRSGKIIYVLRRESKTLRTLSRRPAVVRQLSTIFDANATLGVGGKKKKERRSFFIRHRNNGYR